MKCEIAVEPLRVGNFHQPLDEVFHPIIACDVRACQDAMCVLDCPEPFGYFPV
jgi:hypothetical protein